MLQNPSTGRSQLHQHRCGDTCLIQQRSTHSVGIDPPGGNLGNYVPFYFGGHSPMLLNIKTGYRGITKQPQDDIIFVCCKIEKVIQTCTHWCFTDGHAKDKFTQFYNSLTDLDKVDWAMVRQQYWQPTEEDRDRFRRKQAEFLVKEMVPTNCIESLIVKTERRKTDVEQIVSGLNLNIPVHIDTANKLYYP